jgi:probable H4MPT-linked C1 transfer pathway protein
VNITEARQTPHLTAAANWLALATFACRFTGGSPALLLDIGSTTTDVIPLDANQPVPHGRTDAERFRTGELVYTGARRTPVCALLHDGIAAEFFATTLDVYLMLGQLPEDLSDHGTADGRPATRHFAHARLARMVGDDSETCAEEQTLELARRASLAQCTAIRAAIDRVVATLPEPPRTVILSGSGEFLARQVVEAWFPPPSVRLVSLTRELGPMISQAACAHALAVLAAEEK